MTHDGLAFGRYLLKERIAAGGMGEVYIALQTGIGRFARPIAVKLLLPHLADDPKVVSMFLTEARVGAQMSHANIAQVYDVGFEHGRYFIAMELVRGVSLSSLIAGLKGVERTLSGELLAHIGRSLCDGLHIAHEQTGPDGRPLELVHRDVTPHNVLVSVDGAVKLTDFGIARVVDADRLSRPGVVMGKLGYLAPEQLAGDPVDRRVDIFAAGATLYHLAALARPFDTATGASLEPTRLPQAPLRVLRPDLPRQAIDAIERAMAVEPAARFATAKAFRSALPVPGPDVAESLGRLVRAVCGAALDELEQKTERATAELSDHSPPVRPAALVSPAGSVSPAAPSAPTSSTAVRLPPGARSQRRLLIGLALSAALAGGAAIWRHSGDAVPAPPTADLAAAPSPAPASPSPAPASLAPEEADAPAAPAGLPPPARRASTPPRRAPGASAEGLISVDAVPWATVTLDGHPVGETPLADLQAPVGVHTLVATNPETGKVVRRRIQVSATAPVAVRFDLR